MLISVPSIVDHIPFTFTLCLTVVHVFPCSN